MPRDKDERIILINKHTNEPEWLALKKEDMAQFLNIPLYILRSEMTTKNKYKDKQKTNMEWKEKYYLKEAKVYEKETGIYLEGSQQFKVELS